VYEQSIPVVVGAPTEFTKIEWTKPTDDAGWAEDIKKEQLHLKFDDQLQQMKESHEDKLQRVHVKQFEQATQYPDSIRWSVRQEHEAEEEFKLLSEAELDSMIEAEAQETIAFYIREYEKMNQSVERVNEEIKLRNKGFLSVRERLSAKHPDRETIDDVGSRERSPLGTAYYVDFANGDDAAAGTATTTAWQNLATFTNAARSAGDIVFVRRGVASTTNLADLAFVSDGAAGNPIIVTADYDNLWDDFATSSQTYTPTWGSKTMEASATITGIAANDWIYVAGDCTEIYNASSYNNCEFAYEVESVSGTTLTLYLPYKGEQTGAGNELRVMPDAPIWGTTSSTFEWDMSLDNYWLIKGLDLRSNDTAGMVDMGAEIGTIWIDMIMQGDGGLVSFFDRGGPGDITVKKSRVFNALTFDNLDDSGLTRVSDVLHDANNDSSNHFADGCTGAVLFAEDVETKNFNSSSAPFTCNVNGAPGIKHMRNITYDESGTQGFYFPSFGIPDKLAHEDADGVVGDNIFHSGNASTGDQLERISTTTVTRAGGGATSLGVYPSDDTSEFTTTKINLFELPIYTDTTSKTYTMYFKGGTTTVEFTTSPTTEELWIECHYYRSASNALRGVTKSTGTVDFTTDTDFDQSLAVTCAPAQEGILYLRGWYTKPKEAEFNNLFFVDLTPEIQ
jgi:hypothetical protein